MADNVPEIDLEKIRGEVGELSDDEVREQLLAIRTRQKVQQKKYQNTEKQKAYQLKQREKFKLLKERALKAGYLDEINEEAEKRAEEKLTNDSVPEDEGEE